MSQDTADGAAKIPLRRSCAFWRRVTAFAFLLSSSELVCRLANHQIAFLRTSPRMSVLTTFSLLRQEGSFDDSSVRHLSWFCGRRAFGGRAFPGALC